MHNTYIFKLSPDKIGRQIVIVENNLYVPLQYESFDIKHIGNLGYVSGIIDNQEKLWKVENPVVVTKENLDDKVKIELGENDNLENTYIKYSVIEVENYLNTFTSKEIYCLFSSLEENFVTIEYLLNCKK
jgi:hypothetical protein